jgi:hypothetical protein
LKKTSLFFITALIVFSESASGAVKSKIRGTLRARGLYYTNNKIEEIGQRHRAQLEHETKLNSELTFLNQLRFKYSTLTSDLTGAPPLDKKDQQEVYLGENFFKFQSDSWVLQTGYQEVAWGEAFGFNYADIVNPKDLSETFYADYSESKTPLLMLNYKYFFNDGSLQLIYSPEPKYSKTLPFEIFTKNLFGSMLVNVEKDENPKIFEEHDYGGKLSKSILGIDAAVFYFSHIDREPHYILRGATFTSIKLQEEHNRINSIGLSAAKTLYDDFVIRSDFVYTQDKIINSSLTGLDLLQTKSNVSNFLISIDSPTWRSWSAMMVFATSRLQDPPRGAFREDAQNFAIAKLSHDLGQERLFDLSYTHEFSKGGHGVQGQLVVPLNSSFELAWGGEIYWGRKTSSLNLYKNMSSVFFSVKNYFQLL